MDKQDQNNYFAELISRYLSGNANDAEVQELEAWVLADPENKKQFISFKKAWMLSGMQENDQRVNVEKLWQQTSSQLFRETPMVKMKPKTNRRNWLRIAAAVVMLAVASFWIFENFGNQSPMMVNTTTEVKSFDLPDGSQITLNRSSSLTFTPAKKDAPRQVSLEGDAFFEVARDEAHPFIIQTQGVEIEVLGTSFYVDSRATQSEIQVIVQSGSVAVRAGDAERILKTGEKVIFKKAAGELIQEKNNDPNYLSLKTKTLIFEKTKLEEVVFALNRQFNVDISIKNEILKSCELTATYENQSLEAILLILKRSMGIEVNRVGGKIIWSGEDCQ